MTTIYEIITYLFDFFPGNLGNELGFRIGALKARYRRHPLRNSKVFHSKGFLKVNGQPLSSPADNSFSIHNDTNIF